MTIFKTIYGKILIVICIVLGVGFFSFYLKENLVEELPIIEKAADFTLINQDNEEISLAMFSEKVKILSFFYTRCIIATQCPMITKNFQKLQSSVDEWLDKKIVFLLVSFDPKGDSPGDLKKYGELYDVDFHNWHFLTGTEAVIGKTINEYQVIAEKQESGVFRHSMITFLIDQNNNLRKMYIGSGWDPQDLKNDLINILGRSS